MLLDLSKIHGPRHVVERTFQPTAFDPQDEEYRVAAPVELSMVVEKAGGDAFRVVGSAQTTLEMACGRCLEAFQVPVHVNFDLRYVPHVQNTGVGEEEIEEEDLATAYHREGLIDVVELLREQFQLALPMKPLCSDDCKGLCVECGANLNRTTCGCQPRWEDPRLAALKGLLKSEEKS
jgi:uncharacterized protein